MSKNLHYRTLIISDLHLGSPDSKFKELEQFLKKHTFDHLILNGDIIDGLYLRFFDARKDEYTNFLKYILNLANPKCKITYLIGNHDQNRYKQISLPRELIEIKMNINYKSGNKTYFISHGQQLDGKSPKRIEDIGFLGGVFVYRLNRKYNQRRSSRNMEYKSIVHKIKDLAKTMMVGNSKQLDKKIEQICIQNKVDGYICGHLHRPTDMYINKFHYLNSGDRVESKTVLVETEDHQWSVLYH